MKAEFCIKLDWKGFNIGLPVLHEWLQANAGDQYCGMQAAQKLELWFLSEPSQEIQDDIAAKWLAIDEDSDEAEAYKSHAEILSEIAAKKASAKAKLLALGLSEEEIAAMNLG